MKIIRKIALTELQSLFFSPVAWIILIVFTIQSALAFTDVAANYLRIQSYNPEVPNLTYTLLSGAMNPFFQRVLSYLYLYLPLLTMGLMSRELSSGSIKLLYSSPVNNSQIILGKFLSMMVYGLVLIAVLVIMLVYGSTTIENFDFPIALSGLLGIYLLICAYSAIGLFVSSLTSYQVIAGIGTLALLAFLNNVGRIGQGIDFVREVTYWLNIGGRASDFTRGLISSEDIIYFVLVIFMFLALSILRLKAIRQKAKGVVVWSKYAFVVIAVLGLGYVTSRPATKLYYDATRTKQLTLTENSQNIIARAAGPMTITTYVNLFDSGNLFRGLPKNRITDRNMFEQYLRFKPEIEMKYVLYYHADPQSANLQNRYPGKTLEEMVEEICNGNSVSPKKFRPLSALSEEDQAIVARENYSFVRVFEQPGRPKSYLRMFGDMRKLPSEREISAAVKRVAMDLPFVGFVSGHGERSIDRVGDRGYSQFARQHSFRYALINQGFETEEITLDQPVPEHINIIVIADMREHMTPRQEANLDAYIARGGNMIIAGELNRQEFMNPVAERLGVRFLPGQIVRRSEAVKNIPAQQTVTAQGIPLFFSTDKTTEDDYLPDFVVGNLTAACGEINFMFDGIHESGGVVTMPGCVGLEYTTDKGYSVTPLLMSDAEGSWNELETKEFVDNVPVINTAIGEKEESLPMALALSRRVDGREQKILVLGDSDCMSNGEITKYRAKVPAVNYDMIMATFYWMSDNEVPIDVRRPATTDNKFRITTKELSRAEIWLVGLLPFMLLATMVVIWLRRRGR